MVNVHRSACSRRSRGLPSPAPANLGKSGGGRACSRFRLVRSPSNFSTRPALASPRPAWFGVIARTRRHTADRVPRMRGWGICLLVVALAGCGGGGKKTTAAPAGPAPTPAKDAVPWPAPADPMKLAEKAGLTPETHEFLLLHVHAHLDVFVNGRPVTVPAGIGTLPARGPVFLRSTLTTSTASCTPRRRRISSTISASSSPSGTSASTPNASAAIASLPRRSRSTSTATAIPAILARSSSRTRGRSQSSSARPRPRFLPPSGRAKLRSHGDR